MREILLVSSVLMALGFSDTVVARPLRPMGVKSEAEISNQIFFPPARVKAQVKEPIGQTNADPSKTPKTTSDMKTPISKPTLSTANKPNIVNKVKSWVKGQWSVFKSLVSSDAKPAVDSPSTVTGDQASPAKPPEKQNPVVATDKKKENSAPIDLVLAPDEKSPEKIKALEKEVEKFELTSAPEVPLLNLEREVQIKAADFALDRRLQNVLHDHAIHPFHSPIVMVQKKLDKKLKSIVGPPGDSSKVPDPEFKPKGHVDRRGFDGISLGLRDEVEMKIKKYDPLTTDELRYLNALVLFHQGDRCPVALGLFHKLAGKKEWSAEANYYMSMCAKKMGLNTEFMERGRLVLETQDVYYSPKMISKLGIEVPFEFIEPIGKALKKAVSQETVLKSLDDKALADAAFNIAKYGAVIEDFKLAKQWALKVPSDHMGYHEAQFFLSLAEHQLGDKDQSLKIQEAIVSAKTLPDEKKEFYALVSLNLARRYFQLKKFKDARNEFLKVYKDHPLWLQSLTELGWAQLMSDDAEGAIGNMYSIHSPFFRLVYKPESYVIRTIGYLNLCQYGDAYRTLSILESEYRPKLAQIQSYISSHKEGSYYQTVRSYLGSQKPGDVDGISEVIVREMARHRDFINLQKALNRQIDERRAYGILDGAVDQYLKKAQQEVTLSRNKIQEIRKNLGLIASKPALARNKRAWNYQMAQEMEKLNDHFFFIDLFKEAKAALPNYRSEVVGNAEKRLVSLRSQMEKVLRHRLERMKNELSVVLDNNELLRFEVFSGSGENIRYQVSGGEKNNRVPASAVPKSKALQWAFDGEYWEDEIGHYRSSIKNNCPESRGVRRE